MLESGVKDEVINIWRFQTWDHALKVFIYIMHKSDFENSKHTYEYEH